MIYRTCVVQKFTPTVSLFTHAFSFIVFLLLNVSLFAQAEGNISVTMTPAVPQDQDILSLDIDHGTAKDPVEDVLSVSYTIAYEGFDITEISNPETFFNQQSWFANDQNYVATISFNNTLKEIYIEMYRTDDNPRSGEGYAVGGGGLVVDIEEVMLKKEVPARMRVVNVETRRSLEGLNLPRIELMYDPTSEAVQLFPEAGVKIRQVNVLAMDGRVVATDPSGNETLSIKRIPSGLYLIDVETGSGMRVRKKLYKY